MQQEKKIYDKATWRKILKDKRDGIDPQRREEAVKNGFQKLSPLCHPVSYVLSYMRINSEFDLSELNKNLMEKGQLVLPYIYQETLLLYQVKSLTHLEKHSWGILQPDPQQCLLIQPDVIDLAIVPGLGFDLDKKVRLGYGKGHYDRLLPSLRKAEFLGIGFKEQKVTNLTKEPHDIAMHQIFLF